MRQLLHVVFLHSLEGVLLRLLQLCEPFVGILQLPSRLAIVGSHRVHELLGAGGLFLHLLNGLGILSHLPLQRLQPVFAMSLPLVGKHGSYRQHGEQSPTPQPRRAPARLQLLVLNALVELLLLSLHVVLPPLPVYGVFQLRYLRGQVVGAAVVALLHLQLPKCLQRADARIRTAGHLQRLHIHLLSLLHVATVGIQSCQRPVGKSVWLYVQ